MNKKLLTPLPLLLAATMTGCSLAPYQKPPREPTSAPVARAAIQEDIGTIEEKLYSQHREWRGTRYQLGGLSKRGIDCSGLVYATYRDQLGVELPRTTRYQSQLGRRIRRNELRAGDLVFFKTGHKVRHVGIYIEDGKFFHASTSRGVTISRLSDYYWRDRFWHARRLDLNS
ncbi:NlpC/P60 family protein [Microbulbifer yueqingensis]|uniref:Lipoprotein Spr/probable lipoprotein NlpC n=1 Tax=Microbulbifer yueqingensis TaxID=658219 RepID=A0A1G8V8Q0_9GAMM|nr:NlpC/P60 family protein [Microbulbifer yueqingensis]SDJ62506.1 lipoprotein Spr/probable lipoprotein NlpC [Microbulbifer yueqingensis]